MADIEYRSGQSHEGIDPSGMLNQVGKMTADVKAKLEAMYGQTEVSITDMFEMQMLMNSLNQMSEMSGSVMSAMHSANSSLARKVSA